MQCPWDHSKDELYEKKRQCMILNGVAILRYTEYSKYIKYVEQKYGRDYLKQFKKQIVSAAVK